MDKIAHSHHKKRRRRNAFPSLFKVYWAETYPGIPYSYGNNCYIFRQFTSLYRENTIADDLHTLLHTAGHIFSGFIADTMYLTFAPVL